MYRIVHRECYKQLQTIEDAEKIEMKQNSKNKETVSLELPRNILELLKASCPNVQKYLEYTIIEGVRADLDNGDVFIENLAEKYKVA